MEGSNNTQEQTKKCPKCQERIHNEAKKCKHCGTDLRSWFSKHKILTGLLGLFLFIIIVSAASGGTPSSDHSGSPSIVSNEITTEESKKQSVTENKKEEPKIDPLKVSAVDLAKAYEENEVKADKQYKDKIAEITGKIEDIGVVFSQTYIILSSGKSFSVTNVQCFFEDQAQIDKISELKKGDTITVHGLIEGKSLNVEVKKCQLK